MRGVGENKVSEAGKSVADRGRTASEGRPELVAARRRAGPVIVLLAEPDKLCKGVLGKLDCALADDDVRAKDEVPALGVGEVLRGRGLALVVFRLAVGGVRRDIRGCGGGEDGEDVRGGDARDVFLGEGEEDAGAAKGGVRRDVEVFLALGVCACGCEERC